MLNYKHHQKRDQNMEILSSRLHEPHRSCKLSKIHRYPGVPRIRHRHGCSIHRLVRRNLQKSSCLHLHGDYQLLYLQNQLCYLINGHRINVGLDGRQSISNLSKTKLCVRNERIRPYDMRYLHQYQLSYTSIILMENQII